jgi:hypothetical protein
MGSKADLGTSTDACWSLTGLRLLPSPSIWSELQHEAQGSYLCDSEFDCAWAYV